MRSDKMKALSLAVCVLLLAVFSACAPAASTTTTAAVTTTTAAETAAAATDATTAAAPAAGGGDPVKLSFWTFQNAHQEFMADAANSWNEANPDRPIELEIGVYSYDDNHNNLLISLQSGTGAPDIVDIEIGRFANYLKGTPQLLPLNDIVEPLQDKLIMSRFENYAKDGSYYGVDYHVGVPAIYYNTEICDAAGIDIDAIKTWDQYAEAGKTVLEKTGVPMTTLEVTEHWSFYPLVTQKNSDWLGADGSVTLDDASNAEVLQFLYDMMYDSQIAVPAPGGFHHAEEYYAFMEGGGAASVWMPQWYMNRFTDYMPALNGKIAVRPLPRWEENGVYGAGLGGTGTSITNQSKSPELAKEFLSFAKLSTEGSLKTWTMLGFDPLRWDIWTMDEMKAPNKFTEFYGTGVFDMLVTLKDQLHPIHVGELYPNAQTLVQSSVVFKVLSEKSMSPQEALDAAAQELRAQQ
ncbi:MAG: extracellular solute-binding protein [Clostridiales bacterium]|nr:extracellular solute-binding protein [Clostridiales bacterium]